ncbi:MAG: hypothetical protein LQ348_001121 [Seirophora lacunosa]|nr:MAG: hypothetical protein LQ348_001121 [Seirophora lacunosa]
MGRQSRTNGTARSEGRGSSRRWESLYSLGRNSVRNRRSFEDVQQDILDRTPLALQPVGGITSARIASINRGNHWNAQDDARTTKYVSSHQLSTSFSSTLLPTLPYQSILAASHLSSLLLIIQAPKGQKESWYVTPYPTFSSIAERIWQTSSTTSTATPSKLSFERRVEDVKLSKSDLNTVVMDYLISEGYPSAAQKFASEANIHPTSGVNSIQERIEVREAIHSGDIQNAIERINELNPLLLERDHSLHFALLRCQLVEMIRKCPLHSDDPEPAINFAEKELAPRAPTNPQFLHELECTMTLLIYEHDKLPSDLATMLEPAFRKDLAQRVNEALLKEQGERTKAKLFDLVRLRAWSEHKAREAKKDIPEHLSLGLERMPTGRGKEPMHSNGEGEAMVA